MCGLAGIASNYVQDFSSELVQLEKALTHRGPDDKGYYIWDGKQSQVGEQPSLSQGKVGIVHRRLMIQDTTCHAFQPMKSSDDRYALAFNGEIYNFIELRESLVEQGFQFRSQSDTEVLLAAWQCWGFNVFDKIEGMFAFALFDKKLQQVILARDPFGIKPLYYCLDKSLTFASEIKALLQLERVSKKTSPQAVYEAVVLNQCDSQEHTFYDAIKPVPSGHYVVYDIKNNSLTPPEQYWALSTQTHDISYREAQIKLQSLWHESINYHQRSQVPIGAALSGGLDSSLITSTLSKNSVEPLPTFSYVSTDRSVTEKKWIALMTEHATLAPHATHLKADEFSSCFKEVIQTQDQPFGSLSIIAQHLIYRLAKQHEIKVLLNGQGADEMFGGYYRYLGYRAKSFILQKQLIKAVMFSARAGLRYKLYTPSAISMILSKKQKHPLLVPPWLSPQWFEQHQVILPASFSKHDLKSKLKQSLLGPDLQSLLRVDDLNAMHFGIETRVPFLYRPLVEFVMSLPENFLINDRAMTKTILRDSFKHDLPAKIIARKDKIGFVAKEKTLHVSSATTQEFRERIQSLPFISDSFKSNKLTLEQILYHKPYFRALCTSYYL